MGAVGAFQIFVAVGVVAVPSALIANGFSQVLEESRNAKHAKRRAAAVLLQRQVCLTLSFVSINTM